MRRYFLASYIAHNDSTNLPSFGNVRVVVENGFPSNSGIKAEIKRINSGMSLSSITLMSIFEFKDSTDYTSFQQ